LVLEGALCSGGGQWGALLWDSMAWRLGGVRLGVGGGEGGWGLVHFWGSGGQHGLGGG
jgi:hypothetical protein